jgi:hypothetical protein
MIGAWTGTISGGTKSTYNCSNWGSSLSGDNGTFGNTSAAASYWTDASHYFCNASYKLYCFEN